jgi:hypothetical protein
MWHLDVLEMAPPLAEHFVQAIISCTLKQFRRESISM